MQSAVGATGRIILYTLKCRLNGDGMSVTKTRITIILILISIIILNFLGPIAAGIIGYIDGFEVTNCAQGEEEETAYYHAQGCNDNTSNGKINGSLKFVVRDENNQVVCSICEKTGKLEPEECSQDFQESCTFTTIGNKTFAVTFYESPNCTGKILDQESTQCYFIPTLGKMLLFFLVITLVGISIYWWKRR